MSEMQSGTSYPALRMWIDGEWIGGGGRRSHAVVNPADGSVLGELPLANASDLDRALQAADEGFRSWRTSTPEERSNVLQGAARLIRERVETIARVATLEQGKPLAEARVEALRVAGIFEFYAAECARVYGRTLVRPAGMRSMVVKEAVGPVAAFAPWNFPIANPGRKLGAPIAAGCSVILKPAEETPGAAIEIVRALLDAGLPGQVAQLVFGVPDEVSRHLLASPVIRKLSFTGSTAVGKHLLKLSADTVKRTTMELGGHAPVIIFDDADMERTLDILIAGKIRNAGQVCVSPTRFYVQDGVYDQFLKGFSERLSAQQVGNGLDDGVTMGPLANPRRPQSMERLVADAERCGARIVNGGERLEGKGHFWQPTLLRDVSDEALIMNEEPFGPIAVAAPFSSFDEAVDKANRLPFGLAAYAFTENGRRANLIGDAIEAGMVGVNTIAIATHDTPFQGVKESGFGSEEGREGLEACLVVKAIHHG